MSGTQKHLDRFDACLAHGDVPGLASAILRLKVQAEKRLRSDRNPTGLTVWGMTEIQNRIGDNYPTLFTELNAILAAIAASKSVTTTSTSPAAAEPTTMDLAVAALMGKQTVGTRKSAKTVKVVLSDEQIAARDNYYLMAGGGTVDFKPGRYHELMDGHKVDGKDSPIPYGSALRVKA